MKNSRILIVILVVFILVVLVCAGLYALYLPVFNQQLGDLKATQTQSVEDDQATQTQSAIYAGATFVADQTRVANQTAAAITATAAHAATLTAQPTNTTTPTSTPTITPTPTNTQAPMPNICVARIIGAHRDMFEVPGGGRRANAQNILKGETVEVHGRLEDRGWYFTQYGSQQGWLRSDFVEFVDPGCIPTVYEISHLLGILGPADRLVLDDPFVTNQNNWTDNEGEVIFPAETEYREYQLPIEAKGTVLVTSDNEQLQDLGAFRLATTFSRVNAGVDSYIGLRFRSDGTNYYELRIANDCSLTIYANENLVFQRNIYPGENTCGNQAHDYLEISVDEDNELVFWLNDSESIHYTLGDPDGRYASGAIELLVNHAKSAFDFLVVVAPR